MENKMVKKLVALLVVVTILATDFFALGSSLIIYAAQINSETNNSNIEFSAYFKNGETRVDSIEKSIKTEELRLYAEIKVKNEGYFNGTIEIQNSNFNLKKEILSSAISSIEENKITLKQINAGDVVEVELGIEPIISEKISADLLSKTSTVKLTGIYMESTYKGLNIEAEKLVSVNYQIDENAKAELQTYIITNKVLAINGTNKRIVQLLVKSRLSENQYPIKQTEFNIAVPQLGGNLPESVEVMAIGKLATNGLTEISSEDWSNENGTVQILLNNEVDTNNEISWNRKINDELVVTFVYDENVDASEVELKTDSEIKVYNSKNTYTASHTKGISNQEPNSIIMGKSEIITSELYKGQLYANINAIEKQDIQYNTVNTLIITNKDIAEESVINEGSDTFITDSSELTANTKYISTEINKEKMLQILGQEGKLTIKNGEQTVVINKDTDADADGNIVVNYEKSSTEISITTSKPEKEGTLEIKHTKAITGNDYTRDQLKTVKNLKVKNTIEGNATVNNEKQKVVENSTETSIELKETISKAELTVNKENLSTVEQNDVTVGVKLITSDEKYDLYKNPTIAIKFPEAVENVELNEAPSKLYADEFTVSSSGYDSKNRTIKITLTGEQTVYPQSPATQLYLQLNLKVTLSNLATNQSDKITMTYTNQNASVYEGGTTDCGIVENSIGISAPTGLMKIFNLNSNDNTLNTQPITQQITSADSGKTFEFKTVLVNNTETNMNNVRVLGILPTTENTVSEKENSLSTNLTGISASNATVYYTENSEADSNIEDVKNGWTTNLGELSNAKLYLIKLNSLNKGDNYVATTNVQIPNVFENNVSSYTKYQVVYDTSTVNDVTEESREIGLTTSIAPGLKTDFIAQVGEDELKDGDTVKEGEIIKYTITLENTGTETLQNLAISAQVPEGTVVVEPKEKYNEDEDIENDESTGETTEDITEEELTDEDEETVEDEEEVGEEEPTGEDCYVEKEATQIGGTIQLTSGQKRILQYELRVKQGITSGSEISNKVVLTYNNSSMKIGEIKNKLEEADIRVTLRNGLDAIPSESVTGNGQTQYKICVENFSDKKVTNLKLLINAENINIIEIIDKDVNFTNGENLNEIVIDEIPANGVATYILNADVLENANTQGIRISAKVQDSNGKIYRSNKLEETVKNANYTVTLSSPQNGATIKLGDTVEYNILVENTGEVTTDVDISDIVSEFFQIQAIYINEKLKYQITDETNTETYVKNIDNVIDESVTLNANEKIEIKIISKVMYASEADDGTIIKNIVNINYLSASKSSEEVTHTLKSVGVVDKISGYVWYDENKDGQADDDEEVLQGIIVKLYDTKNNKYLKDDEGNIVQAVTDYYGEYIFKSIEKGSYKIVVEYDMDKYEPTTNSIVKQQIVTIDGEKVTIVGSDEINIQDIITDMNIGLKEKELNNSNNPGGTIIPDGDENPKDDGEVNDTPETKITRTISGTAWLDKDRNGKRDSSEVLLSGIKVRLYKISTKDYLRDNDGNIIETITDDNGKYLFDNIEQDSYIVLFEYDSQKYEPTTYFASGVDTTQNSKAIIKTININGEELTLAVTDVINVTDDVLNINIGLKEKIVYDMELNKYISKIVVQNSKETKTYEYEDKSFAKVEIHRKQIQGSLVVLEYTIKVKNTGEVVGYAKNIVDYLPSGLTFSSELNSEWYLSGDYLYTKGLENVAINPGEEKEIKLILTKSMTNENTGLINNRAEIYQDYNQYGEVDKDSTPNNQVQDEDDFGTTDVIIGIKTGGSTILNIIMLLINLVLIFIAIRTMIKNKIITIPNKRERR